MEDYSKAIFYNYDCVYFKGEKPCHYHLFCEGCPHYAPMGQRILIIKLGAMGDVLRTTAILPKLKLKYPRSYICWLTSKESLDLLEGNPYVNRLFSYDLETVMSLQLQIFDVVISLDKELRGTSLATLIKAKEKFGYGMHEEGNPYPLNPEASYSFALGISDELKFKINQKSYQEIVFETLNLSFDQDEYVFHLTESEIAVGERFKEQNKISGNTLVIGIHPGAGSIFAHKSWGVEQFAFLVDMLNEKLKATILVFGSGKEQEGIENLKKICKVPILETGYNNNLRRFAAVLNCCHLIVSGDTLAMHLAIALKKLTVTLFGPTTPNEILTYGRGVKIVSPIQCSPCYLHYCEKKPHCMELIKPESVFEAILNLLKQNTKNIPGVSK